jgi:HD-GYP domain-containing protein (c-di-GMP phosphodiesterase class II)
MLNILQMRRYQVNIHEIFPCIPSMEKLVKTSLEVGMILPWTVFTEEGELLLSEGSTIKNERVLGLLIGRGAWCHNDEIEKRARDKPVADESARGVSAFSQLEIFRDNLHQLLHEIVKSPGAGQKATLNEHAGELQNLIWKYSDMILGALILDRESSYSKLHPILSSAVSAMIARRLDTPPELVHSITCANMTANLGMLDIKDELSEHEGELTPEHKLRIRRHPERSYEILKSIGITDDKWLEIVSKQHEKLDGSGYPAGINSDAIPDYVRISTIADVYAAMVLPRRYRDGIHCQQAIKAIFAERANSLDESLCTIFIKDIGIFPPGVWVELSNGEKGIVIKRGLRNATQPTVSCLMDGYDNEYERPKIRNLAENQSPGIKRIYKREDELPFSYEDIWGFV